MVIIMTLWIGNGTVLKSSSQCQLKELGKLNNSIHELFIFKIILIASPVRPKCLKLVVVAFLLGAKDYDSF